MHSSNFRYDNGEDLLSDKSHWKPFPFQLTGFLDRPCDLLTNVTSWVPICNSETNVSKYAAVYHGVPNACTYQHVVCATSATSFDIRAHFSMQYVRATSCTHWLAYISACTTADSWHTEFNWFRYTNHGSSVIECCIMDNRNRNLCNLCHRLFLLKKSYR